MSKYEQLAQTLSQAIMNGEYAPGMRLPTLLELCRIYDVSNTTVKKAMDELEQRGLVARRRGSGVYVKSTPSLRSPAGRGGFAHPGWSMSGQMTGLSAEFAAKGKTVTSVVNAFQIIHPNEVVAEALGVPSAEFVYYICRTRLSEDVPQNVEYTFMPIGLVPGLLEQHLYGSIYGYIEGELGLKIGSAHRVLRAVTPTADECAWLGVDKGSPLFEVRQVGYLDDGTPFEYSTTRHTSDYEFYVVSTH